MTASVLTWHLLSPLLRRKIFVLRDIYSKRPINQFARCRSIFSNMSASCNDRQFLIVVLGATGTGKSKLAIELAQKFNGEVISADSMQVYRGLDIITNKVTLEECEGVTHHMLNFVDPLDTFTVVDFRNQALPIIERLMNEGKVPVVVGGTHYYIESLLWEVLVGEGDPVAKVPWGSPLGTKEKLRILLEEIAFLMASCQKKLDESVINMFRTYLEASGDLVNKVENVLESVAEMSDKEVDSMIGRSGDIYKKLEELSPNRMAKREWHARLRELDPARAEELHFNDIRKVMRSLEVVSKSGKKHSDFLREQRELPGGSDLGGPLRFPGKTAVFWVFAEQETLDCRLDARVEDMLKRGLLHELEDFHVSYNIKRMGEKSKVLYTEGIFQSIGFKEFHEYLTKEDRKSDEGRKMLAEGVNNLKIATRRYARRQLKWIINRFLKAGGRQVPPVYQVDGTDPKTWDTKVLAPAVAVVEHFLGLPVVDVPQPLPLLSPNSHEKKQRICKTCMRIFIGNLQWEAHMKSKKHQVMVKKRQKLKENPA